MKRLFLSLLLSLFYASTTLAQNNESTQPQFLVVGDLAPDTIAPIIEALDKHLLNVTIRYKQISPAEWTSRLLAGAEETSAVNLIILSTPDLAVSIANEGVAQQHSTITHNTNLPPQAHWRNELFSIGFDPAVSIIRRSSLNNNELPTTRIELARLMEQNPQRFQFRVGLVNIGIDNGSYTLAAQDSIRSPLFWRIVRAFGASQARIYDDNEELLQALSDGRIDLAYNVPLSYITKWPHNAEELTVILPRDYVLALPWTALIPEKSKLAGDAEQAITFLLSPTGQSALQQAGLVSAVNPFNLASLQPVELGPELLVYLDNLKRSRFLDTWFQLVVQE